MTDWKLNIGLTLALLFAIALAGLIGETSMNADQFFRALFGIGGEAEKIVLWEIRMPRAISAAFVGIALGLSGAALQGLLRNPLAGTWRSRCLCDEWPSPHQRPSSMALLPARSSLLYSPSPVPSLRQHFCWSPRYFLAR